MKSKAPYFPYDKIRDVAFEILKQNGYEQVLPVDVEKIIEFNLKIHISPIPGLQGNSEVDGSTAKDISTIYVNEFVYRSRETRYRFTLAHELGHIVLHGDFLAKSKITSIREWKKEYKSIDADTYSWLESQANNFAGLVLVPSHHLKKHFDKIVRDSRPGFEQAKARHITKERYLEYFIDVASISLAAIFNVSREVIEIRIGKDGLTRDIPL